MSNVLARWQSPRVFVLGVAACGAAYYGGAPREVQAIAIGFALSQVAIAALRLLSYIFSQIYAWCTIRNQSHVATHHQTSSTQVGTQPLAAVQPSNDSQDSGSISSSNIPAPTSSIRSIATAIFPTSVPSISEAPAPIPASAVATPMPTSFNTPFPLSQLSVMASSSTKPMSTDETTSFSTAYIPQYALPNLAYAVSRQQGKMVDIATSPAQPIKAAKKLLDIQAPYGSLIVEVNENQVLPSPNEVIVFANGNDMNCGFLLSHLDVKNNKVCYLDSPSRMIFKSSDIKGMKKAYQLISERIILSYKATTISFVIDDRAWASNKNLNSLAGYIVESFKNLKTGNRLGSFQKLRLIFKDQKKASIFATLQDKPASSVSSKK